MIHVFYWLLACILCVYMCMCVNCRQKQITSQLPFLYSAARIEQITWCWLVSCMVWLCVNSGLCSSGSSCGLSETHHLLWHQLVNRRHMLKLHFADCLYSMGLWMVPGAAQASEAVTEAKTLHKFASFWCRVHEVLGITPPSMKRECKASTMYRFCLW